MTLRAYHPNAEALALEPMRFSDLLASNIEKLTVSIGRKSCGSKRALG
jgi:hypothetical protein